jgi:hypothetical protein
VGLPSHPEGLFDPAAPGWTPAAMRRPFAFATSEHAPRFVS